METLKEQRLKLTDWRMLLCCAIFVCITGRIALILFPFSEERWKFFLLPAVICLTGPVFGLTDIVKQPGMRILIAAMLWMVCVCLMHFTEYRDPELLMLYLLMAAASLFLFYPAAFVLPEASMKRLFCALALVYSFCITVLAVVALTAAFTGVLLPSPGGVEAIGAGVNPLFSRLSMFCNPIEGSLYCVIALLFILLVWQNTLRTALRVLLVAEAVILFAILALMDARTDCWALCVCVGGAGYLLADMRLMKKKGFTHVLLSLLTAVFAAALCFAILRIFSALLNPLIPNNVAVRTVDSKISSLTGRTDVWDGVIRMLKDRRDILFFGAGPLRGMPLVEPYFTFDDNLISHPHSIVLLTILDFGLVGLLLFVAFTGYFLFHAIRLFFFAGDRCTYFERALPLLPVFFLIVDLVETFLAFGNAGDHSNPLYFLLSGYIICLSTTRLSGGNPSAAKEGVKV